MELRTQLVAAGGNSFWPVSAASVTPRFADDCHRLQPRGSIRAPSSVVCVGYRLAMRRRNASRVLMFLGSPRGRPRRSTIRSSARSPSTRTRSPLHWSRGRGRVVGSDRHVRPRPTSIMTFAGSRHTAEPHHASQGKVIRIRRRPTRWRRLHRTSGAWIDRFSRLYTAKRCPRRRPAGRSGTPFERRRGHDWCRRRTQPTVRRLAQARPIGPNTRGNALRRRAC
jgi:hypothetical protein